MSLNFPSNILGDVNCHTFRGKLFHNTHTHMFVYDFSNKNRTIYEQNHGYHMLEVLKEE